MGFHGAQLGARCPGWTGFPVSTEGAPAFSSYECQAALKSVLCISDSYSALFYRGFGATTINIAPQYLIGMFSAKHWRGQLVAKCQSLVPDTKYSCT